MDPALQEQIDDALNQQEEIEAIIRLTKPDQFPPRIRVISKFGDIITCRVKRRDIQQVYDYPSVASFKAPRVLYHDFTGVSNATPPDHFPATAGLGKQDRAGLTGAGVVIGLIDWGADFAHHDFLHEDGSTRFIAIWDQNHPGNHLSPQPYGYGKVHYHDRIDAALKTATPYQTLGYHPGIGDPGAKGMHGTHVMGIATANGRSGQQGVAPGASIIFVHLGSSNTDGRFNLGDSCRVLEAIDFIKRIAGNLPLVINISAGKHGGPHDGSTLVEKSIDNFLEEHLNTAICQSTGNYFNTKTHCSGLIKPGGDAAISFLTGHTKVTENEVEVWYSGKDEFDIVLQHSGSNISYSCGIEGATEIHIDGSSAGWMYHRRQDPNNTRNHVDIFLYPNAPVGQWQLRMEGKKITDGRFHAWIERADQGQSNFVDANIVRTATTNTICNAYNAIVTGAYDQTSPHYRIAPFSSSGPTLDGRLKPHILAPGINIRSSKSSGPGKQNGGRQLVQMSGTSMAAPFITGTVALILQGIKRNATIHDIRNILFKSCNVVDRPTLEDKLRGGYGIVNLSKLQANIDWFNKSELNRKPIMGSASVNKKDAAANAEMEPAGSGTSFTDVEEDVDTAPGFGYAANPQNSPAATQSISLQHKSARLSNVMVTTFPHAEDHHQIQGKYMKERLAAIDPLTDVSASAVQAERKNDRFENDYTSEAVVTFPSGEQLEITVGDDGPGEEYYDPNNSGNPLLDTSGANKDKMLSANIKVSELARSGATHFDKARIDPELIKCLQAIRDYTGKPVNIRSGYRSYGYNEKLSRRSKNVAQFSQHMSGRAADISIEGMTGFEIAKAAIDAYGCNIRTGLAPYFAHIDVKGTFAAWRYAGDPAAMDELVTKIKAYQQACSKKTVIPAADNNTESTPPARRVPVTIAANRLFCRGYLSYETLQAILEGERDIDKLTDMTFYYRHPETSSLGAVLQSSKNGYSKLRTEWSEIRSKLIAPIFMNEPATYSEAELSTGRGREEPLRGIGDKNITGHDDVAGRIKWFNESRIGTGTRTREDMLVAFADSVEAIRKLKSVGGGSMLSEDIDSEKTPVLNKNNWTPLGPSAIDNGQGSSSTNLRVSGRITSIAAGPAGNRVYAGSANGGVWLSVDSGNTWKPLDDFADSPNYKTTLSDVERDALSVGTIAVRFGTKQDDDEIYVGTGEPVGGYLSVFGVGIKHSAKGGTPGSWKMEAKNLSGKGIYKIVIDPLDSKIAYAATTDGLYQRPISGVEAWTKIPIATSTGAVTDFIITVSGKIRTYFAAVLRNGVYSTTDLKNWGSPVAGIGKNSIALAGGGSIDNPERMSLASAENDPSIVYAFHQFYNVSGTSIVFETRLYRLFAGSFKLVSNLPSVFNGGGQGSYNIILGVDPSNDNTVYIAGNYVDDRTGEYPLSLFKGTITSPAAGSFSFGFTNTADPLKDASFVGTGIHADGHAIAFALDAAGTKKDATRVWIGSDGGMFFSDKSGANGSFVARNSGLAITQMTYLAQHPNIPSVVFAGCQDNGTLRYWGEQVWFEAPKGDGGGVAIDPNNPYNVIRQYTRAGHFVQVPGGSWAFSSGLSTNTDGGITNTWNGVIFPPAVSTTPAQVTAVNNENNSTRFYGPIAVSPEAVASTMLAFGTNRLWLSLDWGKNWVTLPSNTNPYGTTPIPPAQDVIGTITAIKIVSATRIFATTQSTVYRYELSGGTWNMVTLANTGLPAAGIFITAVDGDPDDDNNCYISLGGGGNFTRCFYFDNGTTKWYAVGPPKDILKIACHAIVADAANPGTVYLGSDVGVWKLTRKKKEFSWAYEQYSNGLPEVVITDLALHKKGRLLRAATHGRGVWEIAIDRKSSPAVDLYLRANAADDGRINPVTKKRFDFIQLADNPQTRIIERMNLDGSPDILVALIPLAGTGHVFVQANNRGYATIPGTNVRVALFMANSAAVASLTMPKDLAQHINAGDTKTGWLGADWKFADKAAPYKTFPAPVGPRMASQVSFDVDFSDLDLTKGHYVSIVAIISTVDKTEPFKGVEQDLDKLVLNDKQVAYKKIFVP